MNTGSLNTGYMTGYSGERVTLTDGAYGLTSTAVSLGRIPRFLGHVNTFYPVLAHSLVVASLMPPEIGVYGLLHDAGEAVFGDIPTPVKIPEVREYECAYMERFWENLNMPQPTDEIRVEVSLADRRALYAEARTLYLPNWTEWVPVEREEADALVRLQVKAGTARLLDAKCALIVLHDAFMSYKAEWRHGARALD